MIVELRKLTVSIDISLTFSLQALYRGAVVDRLTKDLAT